MPKIAGTVPCKGPTCKAQILWAREGEKKIPLDPAAPVYHIVHREKTDDFRGHATHTALVRRDTTAMVSHFKTCRDVLRFSKGPKKADVDALLDQVNLILRFWDSNELVPHPAAVGRLEAEVRRLREAAMAVLGRKS